MMQLLRKLHLVATSSQVLAESCKYHIDKLSF
jgi:hypothetical protein